MVAFTLMIFFIFLGLYYVLAGQQPRMKP